MRNTIHFPFEKADGGSQREPSEVHVGWNSFVTEVMRFPSYLSPETCARILAFARRYPDEPGRMNEERGGTRRNRVRWIPLSDEATWLFDRMRSLFVMANQRFRFELTGFAESLHTIEYGTGDHIDWHVDCGERETSTRKLVGTILLTDPATFEGGNLEFSSMAGDFGDTKIGDAIVFPAFLSHRVEALRQGSRTILAAWAHGPAFR